MNPLLARFIPEAHDLIEQSASGLLKLEKDPGNDVVINEVFRALHTLKGSSGLFDVAPLTQLLHAGEDLLGAVRSGAIPFSPDMADHVLEMLDQTSEWLRDMERQESLPAASVEMSHKMATVLRALLPRPTDQSNAVVHVEAGPETIDWLDLISNEKGFELFAASAMATGSPVTAVEYKPNEACFYNGDDPLNLIGQIPELGILSVSVREPWASLDELDPYRCNLIFRALSLGHRADIAHLFRYALDQVTITSLRPDALFPEPAQVPAKRAKRPSPAKSISLTAPAANSRNDELSPMTVRILREQLRLLTLAAEEVVQGERRALVAATVSKVIVALGKAEWHSQFEAAVELELADGMIDLLQTWLGENSGTASERAKQDPHKFGEATNIASSFPVPEAQIESTKANSVGQGALSKTLKVDQAKLDALMNLIGELVVSKNSLPFLARRAEEVYGSRDMAREIKDQYGVIDRLAQDMQSAIMAVRMLPVSEVFDRFPRLVRDLARKLSKKIELNMAGEETAADKAIIEALGDPLLHIVRNSIDHGIELPNEREEAGKPSQALISLKAYQESDQVVIEVSDDGRGIDPARIKASALSKGIITSDVAERLSDQDAINLIFHPGFSTALEVSDLSGRGVGMDVVRSSIEKLGGHVSVTSVVGQGTTVRLSLPLSMAVTRVMMVEFGASLVGIPMDVIVETVRLAPGAIHTIKQAETFVLRNAIIPLVRMDKKLGVSGCSASQDDLDMAVLVVRVNGALVGLTVDRFRDSMDVILKPFDGLLAGLSGYAGTALLGDGRVLLVLNLKEML